MGTVKLKVEQKRNFTKQISKKDKPTEEDGAEPKKKAQRIKADRTKSLLESVSAKMDILDFESFDTIFPDLLSSMKEATILRDELIKEIGSEELMKNRPELFSTAKQIECKFDNKVEAFTKEEKQLEKELSGLIAKKKLTVYNR
jgi:hypothetical protein